MAKAGSRHAHRDDDSVSIPGLYRRARPGKPAEVVYEKQEHHDELSAMDWPDGAEVFLRVELRERAWFYADLKHYFGHFVEPFRAHTGYTKHAIHEELFKGQFMPDGKTSLTQLSKPEMNAFLEDVEEYLLDNCPEALSAYYEENNNGPTQCD